MIKVGLTGGIGSGKSTVAKYFKELGVPVYIADTEARLLMNTSKTIKKKLIKVFGPEAYLDDELNRPYLAKVVFNDKEKLKKINNIVHPKVAKDFSKWVDKLESVYCIQENAIIFENNKADQFDIIITVSAPLEVRVQRILKRDAITEEQIVARIKSQWDQEKKNKLADFVIQNIDLNQTKKQVEIIHQKLINLPSD
ncbi:UNVERIFIED_CONTAM: hypothetical protein GTU68_052436 [Idotea baltica]|nr:hypothetical protein [Idotea baltica]